MVPVFVALSSQVYAAGKTDNLLGLCGQAMPCPGGPGPPVAETAGLPCCALGQEKGGLEVRPLPEKAGFSAVPCGPSVPCRVFSASPHAVPFVPQRHRHNWWLIAGLITGVIEDHPTTDRPRKRPPEGGLIAGIGAADQSGGFCFSARMMTGDDNGLPLRARIPRRAMMVEMSR